MKTSTITEVLKKLSATVRKSNSLHERIVIHPLREWVVGISIVFLMVILGGLVSRLLYVSITNDEIIVLESSPTPYKGQVVEKALQIYRERQHAYEMIAGSPDSGEVAASVESGAVTPTTATTTSMIDEREANEATTTSSIKTTSTTTVSDEVPVPPASENPPTDPVMGF